MPYITDAMREYAKKHANDMSHNQLSEEAKQVKEKLFGKRSGGHTKSNGSGKPWPAWIKNTIEAINDAVYYLVDENNKNSAIQRLNKHLDILNQTLDAAEENDKASIERCIKRTKNAIEKIQTYNNVKDSCAKDDDDDKEDAEEVVESFINMIDAFDKLHHDELVKLFKQHYVDEFTGPTMGSKVLEEYVKIIKGER